MANGPTRIEDRRERGEGEVDLRDEEERRPDTEAEERHRGDGRREEPRRETVEERPVATERVPRAGVLWTIRILIAGIIIAAVGLFAAANTQTMETDLLVTTESVAMTWPIVGAGVAGLLAAALMCRWR